MNLDISAITSQPAFASAAVSPEKIWTIQDGACAGGAVMLIRRDEKIVLVKKAERPGYEFSGQLAMPGGLIRAAEADDFEASFRRFLFERVKLECGLEARSLRAVKVLDFGCSPVSGYTAKGKERRTLVVAVEAVAADAAVQLGSSDGSVESASWYDLPPPWQRMAPANCLIVAAALAGRLSAEERAHAKAPIDAAFAQCKRWATDVGLTAAAHPFEEHD